MAYLAALSLLIYLKSLKLSDHIATVLLKHGIKCLDLRFLLLISSSTIFVLILLTSVLPTSYNYSLQCVNYYYYYYAVSQKKHPQHF